MMTEPTRVLALPGEEQFKADIKAINQFQHVARVYLISGQDYGVIPGTTKPTLLKPGAEKIAKLLGLADEYTIEDREENWDKPFFHYLIKCKLVSVATGIVISEGLGECNSMESKYRYRWLGERDLPQGVDKTKLVTQERYSKTGGHWTVYRLENEDVYSQVNTILKMAKKRALVDAALSAGRLSQVFTQDIEDLPEDIELAQPASQPVKSRKAEGLKQKIDETVAKVLKEGEEQSAPHQPKATTEPEPIPNAIDELLCWIAVNMGWKNASGAKTWIVNVCKISEERINKDPEGVKQEVAQLKGWTV